MSILFSDQSKITKTNLKTTNSTKTSDTKNGDFLGRS